MQDANEDPLMVDRSGHRIEYDHYSSSPIIGATAPTIADIMKAKASKKRKQALKKTLNVGPSLASDTESTILPQATHITCRSIEKIFYVFKCVSFIGYHSFV